ncbi:hypothetical protein Sulac_1699 [Sulfobacillus acidophilus DSM 10332]|uniref:Uncharacterized protein n=1 Tax=Sulfobacillus acidophilus (strain ATCC 700253 / DSM 10332 / NAL) TaxID=679936 RepID=G8TZF5_SULAD|nr:hypothetical protein Sulac_1699 [Sulfobacillus acidophilus DSM 10332]
MNEETPAKTVAHLEFHWWLVQTQKQVYMDIKSGGRRDLLWEGLTIAIDQIAQTEAMSMAQALGRLAMIYRENASEWHPVRVEG